MDLDLSRQYRLNENLEIDNALGAAQKRQINVNSRQVHISFLNVIMIDK